MRPFSIKTRVSLTAVLACVALVALGTAIQVHFLRADFKRVLARQQAADAARVADQIDDKLRSGLELLTLIGAQLPGVRPADAPAIGRFLREQPAMHRLIDDVIVVDPVGRVMADAAALPGRIGYDVSSGEAFGQVVATRTPHVSRPFLGHLRTEPLLTLAVPVLTPSGELRAVVIGVLRLYQDNLLGRLAGPRVGQGGYYSILTRESPAIYVMHRDRNKILHERPTGGNPLTTRALRGQLEDGEALNSEGRPNLYAYRNLKMVDWLLISALPTDEAIAPLRDAETRAFVLAAILVLLGSPLCWLLVRRLLAPVTALHAAIIQARDVTAEFRPVAVDRPDEIGELTDAFNQLMRERITRVAEFAAMNDAAPHGMFRTDGRGSMVYANRTLARIFGVAPEAMTPRTWRALLLDDDLRRFENERARALAERAGYNVRLRIRRPDGAVRLLAAAAAPILVDGQLQGFAGTAEDITERTERDEERRMLAAVLERSTDLVAMTDRDGTIRYANPSALRFRGAKALDEVRGTTVEDHFPPAVARRLRHEAVPAALRDGVWTGLSALWDATRREVPVHHMMIACRTPAGRIEFIANVLRDVSEQQRAERALRDSEAHLRAITDNMPAMVAYIDRDERFRYVNRMYRDWLGIDPAGLVGRSVRDLYGDLTYERVVATHLRRALSGEAVDYERGMQTVTGERQFHVTLIPHRDDDGHVLGVHVMKSDVTARSDEARRLRQLSLIDPLTGLSNRSGFELNLDQAIDQARRTRSLLALMYIDVDRFKSINDTHGHPAGDALLREFANRLRRVMRESDGICRIGGDEFTLVIARIGERQNAAAIADKIIEAMRAPFDLGDQTVAVTASIGVAFHDGGPASRESLERDADAALYAAKRAGRDRYRIAPRTVG